MATTTEFPVLNTVCRDCRDEAELNMTESIPVADFILWGKLFPAEALGPKCTFHAAEYINIAQVDQYAVLDLRAARRQAADGVYSTDSAV